LGWEPSNIRLRAVIALLIPNGLSVGVNYAGNIVDTAFASTALQSAALGALYNAWLLVGLPIALLGQAVGQAAFPRLAAHAERGEWPALRRTVWVSLLVALSLAVLALIGLYTLGRSTIRILFERGEFLATAGDLTYQVLIMYAVALPAYVGTEVITRGLIALRDTRTPLMTNLMQLLGRIIVMTIFVPRAGVVAIPAALALTASIETLILASVLYWRLRGRGKS
jgi:putative peptidoglycan lipid II flippase